MRVAIVHDYLTHFGGAERVLQALMELFPHAPVYTLVYNKRAAGSGIDTTRIKTSFLQHVPGATRSHRFFPLALMPIAIEQFDFSQFDVVVSATHSFGKGIITPPDTLHISYCFTPTRYAWDDSHRYARDFSRNTILRRVIPLAVSYVRLWDAMAAARVDTYVTLSDYVAARIRKYYGRSAYVISPPVDTHRFLPRHDNNGYYVVVSRLVPYKRVDIAVDACEKLGVDLKVIGSGPELAALKKRAKRHTEFLGFVSDSELPHVYQGAKALLFPQEEDFGITPIEAAASGKPTIAYRAGGAQETIQEGVTGHFFDDQSAESMADAIRAGEAHPWNSNEIARHASQYSRDVFLQSMGEFVHNQYKTFEQIPN